MLLVPSQKKKNSFCTVCAREYLLMLKYIQFRDSTTTIIILITHKNYIIFWLSVYDEALEAREIERKVIHTIFVCFLLFSTVPRP